MLALNIIIESIKTIVIEIIRKLKISNIPYNNKKLNISKNKIYIHKFENKLITRVLPKFPGSEIHKCFSNALIDNEIDTYICVGKKWRVWGKNGAVINDANYFIEDLSREFSNKNNSLMRQFRLCKKTYLNGTTALISTVGFDTYYHWLFDILPRIILLKKSELFEHIDNFIVTHNNQPFQLETLSMFGIDKVDVICPSNHWKFHVECESLFIPSLPSKLDIVPNWVVHSLRDTLLPLVEIETKEPIERIYIKRVNTRRIINEKVIEEILLKYKFTEITLEDYSIKDQIKLFFNAKLVVGAHGSGFSNIVFCSPITKIIEFFSSSWINICFWSISNNLNQDYYCLISNDCLDHKSNKTRDVYVNPSKLDHLLNELINDK